METTIMGDIEFRGLGFRLQGLGLRGLELRAPKKASPKTLKLQEDLDGLGVKG